MSWMLCLLARSLTKHGRQVPSVTHAATRASTAYMVHKHNQAALELEPLQALLPQLLPPYCALQQCSGVSTRQNDGSAAAGT